MDNSGSPIYLQNSSVVRYLSWDTLVPAIEEALRDVSFQDITQVIQPVRLIAPIPQRRGEMLCMPTFSGKRGIMGCKVSATFEGNVAKGLPSTFNNILLMDSETGKVKMIMEGVFITGWRTAAVSVIATRNLHRGEKKVLAILGAGRVARWHGLAFQHFFNFTEVRVWNRTFDKAKKLCAELGSRAKAFDNNEHCVRGADVIVTATFSPRTILREEWLKPGVHINAVGFGENHYDELELDVYQKASVVVDTLPAAQTELKGLIDAGIRLDYELGEIICKTKAVPGTRPYTVFQCLGMALEDVTTAELVYRKYNEIKSQL